MCTWQLWYVQIEGVPVKGKKGVTTSDKPENRAMATRYLHLLTYIVILRFWQVQLLDVLVRWQVSCGR